MSFVLKQKDSYVWPVNLLLPGDGGRREKSTFDAEFKRLPQSRLNELAKMAKAEDDDLTPQDIAREILIGWSGIVDDAGKEVPFSTSALDQLLDVPSVAGQIVTAFYESYEDAKKQTSKGR
jgi:hypothetical protein